MKDNYIVALEIGSSKIMGAVGAYQPDGTLKILAVEQEESRDSVRYGIIQNPEEVASRVIKIIDRLQANPAVAPRIISGVFVGLSGRSMRSIPSEVKLIFPEETEITAEIIQNLRNDAVSLTLDSNQEILEVVPRYYQIDGMETSSPKGAMGKSVSAVFDLIVGRGELQRNIRRAFAYRTGLDIKGLIVTPLAAADIVLSDEEKRLGCMLVDFGAETTSVSIFRKGALAYYATLPLGGRNITRDLTTLSILEEKAEEIKCESGRAIARETPSTLNLNGIKLSDVSNLVVARAEEIVANVIAQIDYAGLKEKDLPAGIVCIGSGAHLHGMLELLETQSGLNARMGHTPPEIQAMEPRAKRHDTIQVAALLYAGALTGIADCTYIPADDEPAEQDTAVIETPDSGKRDDSQEGKVGKFFRGISSKLTNMFGSNIDDDSELN